MHQLLDLVVLIVVPPTTLVVLLSVVNKSVELVLDVPALALPPE